MDRRIRGILFDLGDTLLHFGKVDVRGMFEAGARLAYAYLADLDQPLPPFASYHRRQLRAIRWSYLVSRLTGREFNAMTLIRRFARRMGHELTDEQFLELAWLWYKPLSDVATVEDGAVETLRELTERITLGVISNTFVPGEVLDRHLAREGMLELLPVRVYSCNVRHRKPSRRIFRIALERAGLDADEVAFVGDSPNADVRGAKRAGLVPILKDPTGRHHNDRIRPDYVIGALAELTGIVERHNAG